MSAFARDKVYMPVRVFGGPSTALVVAIDANDQLVTVREVAMTPPVPVPTNVSVILTVDPVAPVDDTCWFFRDGATPETVSIKVRIGGVTVAFPLGQTT